MFLKRICAQLLVAFTRFGDISAIRQSRRWGAQGND